MPASARWSSSASPISSVGARRVAQAAKRLGGIEVGRQEVRPERRERRVEALGARLEQLDDRGVEADRDRAGDLEDEAGPAGRPAPALAGPVAVPRAVHPQVRPQLEAAVEPDQQVLAQRLDRVDRAGRRSRWTCGPGPGRARAARTSRPTRYGRRPAAVRKSVSPSGIGVGCLALPRAADGQAAIARRRSRPRAAGRGHGDSPTGSPSTLRMTSSRTRPSRRARPAPASAAAATSGSSAAGSVWSVEPPRSRYSAATPSTSTT